MSRTIIAGYDKNNNFFFLKVVSNLTIKTKYKVILEIHADSCDKLLEKITHSENEILNLNLKSNTPFHFGINRDIKSKKLERCENLNQEEIACLKTVVQVVLAKAKNKILVS